MNTFDDNKIFSISNNSEFEQKALDIFKFQFDNNLIYNRYCSYRGKSPDTVSTLPEIPFLPIQFFRQYPIIHKECEAKTIFLSSGTTSSMSSKHHVAFPEIYEKSFLKTFQYFYGDPAEYSILALLPSYLEREGSSLIYMVTELIRLSKHNGSNFYLHNYQELFDKLIENEKQQQKTILIGVSFALLDFASKYKLPFNYTQIIETGGMKGRGKELTRQELHSILQNSFGPKPIHSEYGMTELLSQAYSTKDGVFHCPPWMKIMIRDVYDPFTFLPIKQKGGINIIDLANIYSCSFIETQDIGQIFEDNSFEINGRIDQSQIRGCNLMI